jgi:hypothetical protein
MTEQLKTLLHDQASAAEFAAPDLDHILSRGDRTVRRRRGRTGLVAAVVAAGGVAAALTIGGDGDPNGVDTAADPVSVTAVTWATGSTLHTPEGGTDVGHPIVVYVRTAAGFAFLDPQGVVRTLVDGVVTEVGRSDPDHPQLYGDADGSLVVWRNTSGSGPRVGIADLSGGSDPVLDELGDVQLYAVDGRTVYLRHDRGPVALDVDTGETTSLDPSAQEWPQVAAAEDGLVAFLDDDGFEIRAPGRAPVPLADGFGDIGAFSPDGSWFTVDADHPRVYDARTGTKQVFDLDDAMASGIEWLDDDTLVVLATKTTTSPVRLLSCQVPEGTCHEVAVLGTMDEVVDTVALPLGQPLTG